MCPDHPLPRSTSPRDSHAQPPHRPLQRVGDEMIMEQTPDGPDYTRLCPLHQWASRPSSDLEHVGRCPHCAVEFEERQGRLRYAILHTRLVMGVRIVDDAPISLPFWIHCPRPGCAYVGSARTDGGAVRLLAEHLVSAHLREGQ